MLYPVQITKSHIRGQHYVPQKVYGELEEVFRYC